jgi:hypothetical protein
MLRWPFHDQINLRLGTSPCSSRLGYLALGGGIDGRSEMLGMRWSIVDSIVRIDEKATLNGSSKEEKRAHIYFVSLSTSAAVPGICSHLASIYPQPPAWAPVCSWPSYSGTCSRGQRGRRRLSSPENAIAKDPRHPKISKGQHCDSFLIGWITSGLLEHEALPRIEAQLGVGSSYSSYYPERPQQYESEGQRGSMRR